MPSMLAPHLPSGRIRGVTAVAEAGCKRLEARELACVRGDRRLFADISFSLGAGELLHVAGPNGSGKTTLLRMVCGLVRPVRGEVRWGGRPIGRLGEEYLRRVTHVGHANAIKDDLTCRENLLVSTTLSGAPADPGRLRMALERMGLSGVEALPTKLLSQGQKRRLALARLPLADTPLWILDEPFTALDSGAVKAIRSMLEEHLDRGGMVVLTTHQDVPVDARVRKRLEMHP